MIAAKDRLLSRARLADETQTRKRGDTANENPNLNTHERKPGAALVLSRIRSNRKRRLAE